MRFGLNLPNFGPGMNPGTLRGWAEVAENLGYHLLLVSDHVALTDDAQSRSPTPFFESFTTLSWLAGITSSISLGTGVAIGPHRHPLLLARMAGTLAHLSDGRFILGVGVGWTQLAFAALGVPFHQRGRITDEYLEEFHRMLSGDDPAITAAGYAVHPTPSPKQAGGLPLWIGGNGSAALRRAARFGTAWHPLHPHRDTIAGSLAQMAHLASEHGRPTPSFCPRIALHPTARPLPDRMRALGQGTVEQIRADLALLQNHGAEHIVLDTDPGRPDLRRCAEADWELLRFAAAELVDTQEHRLR